MLTAKAAAAALSVSGFLVENMLTTSHGRTHLDREIFLIKNHRSTILLQKKWNDGRAVMSGIFFNFNTFLKLIVNLTR